MATAEQPLVVSASRWIAVVPAAAFGAAAVALVQHGLNHGAHWRGFVVSTLATLLCAAEVVVHPRLEIRATTVTRIELFRRRVYDLRQCGRFHARYVRWHSGRWIVEFDSGDSRRRRYGNSHFESYGRDGHELAQLLNTARERARRA